MVLFYGAALPLRQLRGLLLPGLPRGRIASRGRRGVSSPLASFS